MRSVYFSFSPIMLILVLIVIFLLVRAGRRSRRRGPAVPISRRRGSPSPAPVKIPRPPPPRSQMPPGPPPAPPAPVSRPMRPPVNLSQLILAIPLSPVLLPLWALASVGDLIIAPILFVIACVSTGISLFFSLIGLDSHGMWQKTGKLFERSARHFGSIFGRLLSTFGLGGVVDRISMRPAPAAPPAPAKATGRAGGFDRTFPFEDDYRIESHLGSGGSTARLFVVQRVKNNRPIGDRLVLKYFDLDFGSRLEEVIRESRGMQLAKEMGIVLDHRLAEDHFYYVMPYYAGETLTRAAARIHRHLSASDEMPTADIRTCLTWLAEILRTLDGYHRHGVIHKDVKPDNVIVTDEGIRLVDLGLLTPLTSAMTLTTHGTEYFRDPEMVKQAVAGKRVKDVHAVRFDVYSSGAVLYYLLEGSFPACGPLSRFSRPVPMVLSWVVSRAMAEGDKRYPSMVAMRADLDAVIHMLDEGGLEDVPVSRLPSFSGFDASATVEPPPPPDLPSFVPTAAPARSVKPLRSVARPRRGAGVAAMLIGLFVAFLVAVGIFAWRVEPSEPSGPVEVIRVQGPATSEPVFSDRVLADQVSGWIVEMAQSLPTLSTTEAQRIPILMIADGSEHLDLSVAAAERRLAGTFPVHRSATLAASIRKVLRPGVKPETVQIALMRQLGTDTFPFVVWVREIEAEPRSGSAAWVQVHFYYRTLSRFTVMNGDFLDTLEAEVRPDIADTEPTREAE